MMTSDDYRHFVCIVAGESPDVLMKPYDMSIQVEPYVVYYAKDADKIKDSMIQAYQEKFIECEDADMQKEILDCMAYLQSIDSKHAFDIFTMDYDKDPKTGDAISTENKIGKWDTYNIGKLFSVPFYTIDGRETYQENKGNVAWDLINGNNKEFYEKVWNMVMEGYEPTNEKERNAYENMKDKQYYFNKFGDKNTYVASNTAFWGYAFLSEKTGWVELTPETNQFEWMTNYYDKFIKDLPDNTMLTIFECRRL